MLSNLYCLSCVQNSLHWHWKINIHNVVSRSLQKQNYFWSIMVVSQQQSNFCRCKLVFMSFFFVAIDEIVQTCGQSDCLWCHPLCSYEWAQIFWILFSVDDWLFCWATSTPILGLAASSCTICLHHEFFPPPAFKCWPIQLGFGRGSCKVFSTWHIQKLQKLFSCVSGNISGYLMEALSAVSYWKNMKNMKTTLQRSDGETFQWHSVLNNICSKDVCSSCDFVFRKVSQQGFQKGRDVSFSFSIWNRCQMNYKGSFLQRHCSAWSSMHVLWIMGPHACFFFSSKCVGRSTLICIYYIYHIWDRILWFHPPRSPTPSYSSGPTAWRFWL